jgi:hypothetical protein
MRTTKDRWGIVAGTALASALMACAEAPPREDEEDPDAGPDDVPTITLAGILAVWPGDGALVDGDVCWRDEDGELCTTTDDTGRWALNDVPANADGLIAVQAEDLYPTLLPMILGEEDLGVAFGLDSLGFIDDVHAWAGVAQDPSFGVIPIQTTRTRGGALEAAGGTAITLSPATGWEGPFYLTPNIDGVVPGATVSSAIGVAYFLHVDPSLGPFEVIATDNGVACDAAEYGTGLPRLPVEAGTETHVRVSCP